MNERDLLQHGVDQGIISAEQRDALRALGGVAEAPREARRAFNGVTIAYGIGALVVLFAFAWFLVDRWRVLGDSGIFGLALAYGSVFLLVAHVLHREGFETARGVAVLLAVGMVPLAMRALLRWSGLWTPELDLVCSVPEHPFTACQGEPLAIELAAVAAALVALRQLPFPPLMIPIAVVCVSLPERLLREWSASGDGDGMVMGWRFVIVASVLSALAYAVDRRRRDEDYAGYLWIAVAVCAFIGGVNIFVGDRSLRPWMLPAALGVIMASVYLRRRVLLLIGLIGVLGFLGWLANDVFKLTVAFPLVLAMLGVAIIIITVWLQKRFPHIVRQLGGDPTLPPRLPGGMLVLLAPAALGLLLLGDARTLDREAAANQRSRSRAKAPQVRAHRDSLNAKRTPAR